MKTVVLIVDDEPKNMKLARDVLNVHGYSTLEAVNGRQGVDMCMEHKPDIVLMDIQMPVLDGISAIKELKCKEETRRIPVLALSAFAMKGDKERILEAGSDGYISKPIEIKELLKTVEQMLKISSET